MKDNPKVKIEKERTIHTYAELWHTSKCLLKKGQDNEAASFHQFMASLVFTAFTLEAYLNHIGAKIFTCWNDLERLSPKEKINVIAEKLSVQVDYGKRPWQIMKKLFGFRNDIAHGKSVEIKSEEVIPLINHTEDIHDSLRTSWEMFCTERKAIKAREDVENIIKTIHKASGIKDDYPFVFGLNFGSATVIE
ncbi:hypothetical protein BMS3Bbin08_00151 [bacterium BMS3Bbin08]|nr:hypothetical protein BMS3Bbin08_00151 [bacterium BMS3Bbin08]